MPHLDNWGRWQDTPEFSSLTQRNAYFEREITRWRDGYINEIGEQVMSGLLYFYLTVGSLKNVTGKICRPKWRDGDFLVFNHFLDAKDNNKNCLYIKRREFGLTSGFGGCVPMHTGIMNPGTVSILTSASDDRLADIRVNKLNPYRDTLVEMGILPSNNLMDSRRFSFASRDNPSEKASEIRFMDTNKDDRAATNMESQRALYIFLDEYFLHNRAELVLMSAMASMKKGEKQVGNMVMGGSCNNINKQSVPRLRVLLDKYAAYNLSVLFIPATYNYEPYEDANGFSLHDKAQEAILKERDKLRDMKAWDMLDNFVKSYPLTMKDLTSSEGANVISAEIASVLQKSREICMTMDDDNYRYRLLQTNTHIFPDIDPKGNFYIFNHPQAGHTYIAGSDPIPFTIGASDKGSDFVCAIKDVTTDQYVAYMSIRTQDADYAFSEFEKILMYYKSPSYPLAAPCNMERNRGEVIMQMCKSKGKMYLLATMPGEKYPGYTKTGEGIIARLFSGMVTYLKYCGTICIPRFLNDMDKFPIVKSDLIDSLQGCELLASCRDTKSTVEQEPSKHQVIKRDRDGKTFIAWE